MTISRPPRKFDWLTPAFLFGSATYLYANLFACSRVPLLLGGDQTYFWMNAQRMLGGEHIYRDFFEITPPGTDLIYLAMFKLFGPRIWVTNGLVLVLGVILCWVCLRISALILDKRRAFLTAGIFLIGIYGKLLNGTHHLFSLLAVMAAVAILMKARTPQRIALAGSLLGLASFFTQTRGAAALMGVTVYLAWEHSGRERSRLFLGKRLALLFISCAVSLAVLSGYVLSIAGISRVWYFQVTYVRHYMLSKEGSGFLGLPGTLNWETLPGLGQYLFVYALLPVVYVVSLWRCGRSRRDACAPDIERAALLALVGLCMLIEVALSVNWLRVYCVAMPAIILLVWLPGRARFRSFGTALLWLAIVCLGFRQSWTRHHQPLVVVRLPAGSAATALNTYEKAAWLMQNLKAGQMFFQAEGVALYLPLARGNPAFVDVLARGDQGRPEFIERTIGQLEAKKVEYVIWPPSASKPLRGSPPGSYHLAPFLTYLHSHYERVWTFSDQDEVWHRKL